MSSYFMVHSLMEELAAPLELEQHEYVVNAERRAVAIAQLPSLCARMGSGWCMAEVPRYLEACALEDNAVMSGAVLDVLGPLLSGEVSFVVSAKSADDSRNVQLRSAALPLRLEHLLRTAALLCGSNEKDIRRRAVLELVNQLWLLMASHQPDVDETSANDSKIMKQNATNAKKASLPLFRRIEDLGDEESVEKLVLSCCSPSVGSNRIGEVCEHLAWMCDQLVVVENAASLSCVPTLALLGYCIITTAASAKKETSAKAASDANKETDSSFADFFKRLWQKACRSKQAIVACEALYSLPLALIAGCAASTASVIDVYTSVCRAFIDDVDAVRAAVHVYPVCMRRVSRMHLNTSSNSSNSSTQHQQQQYQLSMLSALCDLSAAASFKTRYLLAESINVLWQTQDFAGGSQCTRVDSRSKSSSMADAVAAERTATATQFLRAALLEKVEKLLLGMARDPEADVRAMVAEKMGAVGDLFVGADELQLLHSVLEACRDLTLDNSTAVRSAAVKSIDTLASKCRERDDNFNKSSDSNDARYQQQQQQRSAELTQSIQPALRAAFDLLMDEDHSVRLAAVGNISELLRAYSPEKTSEAVLNSAREILQAKQWRVRVAFLDYFPALYSSFERAPLDGATAARFDRDILGQLAAGVYDSVKAVRDAAVAAAARLSRDGNSAAFTNALLWRVIADHPRARSTYLTRCTSLSCAAALRIDKQKLLFPMLVEFSRDAVSNVRGFTVKIIEQLIKESVSAEGGRLSAVVDKTCQERPYVTEDERRGVLFDVCKSLIGDEDADVRHFAGSALRLCV